MTARIISPERRQRALLPESLDELLPVDHPARVFAAVVDTLDMHEFETRISSVDGHAGRPAFCPRMLLLAWLFATSRGIGSAREIARLSKEDLSFRWIFGGTGVKRTVLTEFRVAHLERLQSLFTNVLCGLVDAGAVDVDFIAIDGVRLRANAGDGSFRRRESLHRLRDQAELHVRAVFSEADDGKTTARVKRVREAKAKDLQERTKRAIDAVKEMHVREAGKTPSERNKAPRASTTDPDSRIMKHGHNEFAPGYNVRLAVAGDDRGGPRTIVGVEVTNQGTDRGGVTPVLDDVERRTKKRPRAAVADKQFLKTECVDAAERRGTTLYISFTKNAPRVRETDSRAMAALRARMQQPSSKLATDARSGIVELPFAWWRERFGMRQLPVRGKSPVASVVLLLALTFNIMQHAATLLA